MDQTRFSDIANKASTHHAMNTTRMVTWEWLPHTDIITTSDNFSKIYGLSPEAGAAEGLELVWPEDKEAHQAKIRQIAATGGEYISEFRITRPDTGELVWLEERAAAFVDNAGRIERVIGMTLDITERKQIEEALHTANYLITEQKHAEERLQQLQSVTASFAAAQTLTEVRDVILDEVTQVLGADSGCVRHVKGDVLVLEEIECDTEMSKQETREALILPLQDPHPAAEAAHTGKAVFFKNAEDLLQCYPDLAEYVAEHGLQASAHLPMKDGQEVFAVLSLNFVTPYPWDVAQRAFALTLADRSAIAYERARLFETEKQARTHAEHTAQQLSQLQGLTAALANALTPAQIADVFIDQGLPATGAVACWFALVTPDGHELEVLSATGYPPDLVDVWSRIPLATSAPIADAIRTGADIWIESRAERDARYPAIANTDSARGTWAAIPVIVNERAIGGIGLSFSDFDPVSDDERRFILSAVQQCAQALARAELQTSLRDSEARYRTLVEASAQIIWRADNHGDLLERMERWSTMSGIPLDELPEEPLDIVHPEDRPYGERSWHAALEFARVVTFEQRVLHADGSYHHWQVRAAPVMDADGRVREWIGTDTDITEHKRAENARRDYTRRLQRLNSASLAINAATTREAQVQRIMEEARDLIGAELAIINLVPQGDWAQTQSVVSLAEHFAAWYQEVAPALTSADGYRLIYDEKRTLRLTQAELETNPYWHAFQTAMPPHSPLNGLLAAPLIGSDGMSIGVILLFARAAGEFTPVDEALLLQLAQLAAVALENLTLYEQEQAARAQAEEANRLKDEFLATVSHELRTPLTALLGYAQLLQLRKRDEAYIARTLEKIVRSAKDQTLIIEDLLDVSRIVSGKLNIELTSIDLITVVQAAVDTMRPTIDAKGIALHVVYDLAVGTIIGDANRLQQVVWNLLANATKFTAQGGSIAVHVEAQGGDAVIRVSDTGQGINPAFLPFVFDRFRQGDSTSNRSHGGLGLGLSIVRHLIELHGGTVDAASAGEGQGSTFTVHLPRACADDIHAPVRAIEHIVFPPELHGLRVLLVDDQPVMLDLLQEILTPGGTVIQVCTTAREALTLVQEWHPDILVADIAMPGEDGYWLIGQVRALAPAAGGNTPAIALTAYVRAAEQAKLFNAGFQRYLSKPVDPTGFCTLLAHLARTITP